MSKKKEKKAVDEATEEVVEEVVVEPSYVGRIVKVQGHQVLVRSELKTERGVLVTDEAGVSYLL